MLFTVVSAGKISVRAAPVSSRSVCVCMHNERRRDMILSPAPRCSDSDSDGSADSIPPLLPATFEFNHCGSAVVQITLGSSTPSHYPDRN